ncbi:TldD/PmbA family protein [Klebsiella variicola]|uniref:TldD/PmbA family protein n=3 Tax=Klebsiella variicola TaxID=244366 RepID=UPI000E2B7F7A|nr:metallopeptidase TldD-related protein [Klebsiella variicola]SXG02829.1 peptidase PmbA [Klebsiella variicola]
MSTTAGSGLPDDSPLPPLAELALDAARQQGADRYVINVSQGERTAQRFRRGEIERLTQNRGRHLSVTLFFGQRAGSASTSELTPEGIASAVASASTMARYGDADPWAGLPEPQQLAGDFRGLALFDPEELSAEAARDLALRTERAIEQADPARCVSEGTEIVGWRGEFLLANSHGFFAGYPSSSHTLWGHALAKSAQDRQQGFWQSTRRSPRLLDSPEALGRTAAERALRQLDGGTLTTRRCPVLFEAPVAHSLVHQLVSALSGGALARNASFLGLCAGEAVAATHLSLLEDPFIPGGAASGRFDGEGIAGSARTVLEAGVVNGYFLGSYSARRLGLAPTGNAGGAWNLSLHSAQTRPEDSLAALVRRLHHGLLVTTLLGSGLNPLTGDYSQGVAGFWVENGEIQRPVAGITIAGNLQTMLRGVVALGADVHEQGNLRCGSLLIDDMQVAGQ